MTQQKKKKQANFKIPRFIIQIGKFLQLFSSTLTTRYVRFLFQKPIKHKMPLPERPLLSNVEMSSLEVPEINKTIAVYKWGNGNKKALLVHGWSGRATQMYKIINALLAKNYTVYSFDGPAHGKSSGRTTMMPEFIKTVDKIAETYGKFDIAIGHSLGGISTMNVQADKAPFDKIVVIGTPDSIKNIFHGFIQMLELKPKIAKKLIAVFEKITGKNIESFHGSVNAEKIEAPTLIIHDDDDSEVAVSDALNNYKHLKNGKLLRTKGLGHNRILKDEKVIDEIMTFVE